MRRGHSVTLLEGVPGAGKTEVYLEAVAAVLGQGRQVLVLLPEIALSAQLLERFARRFGTRARGLAFRARRRACAGAPGAGSPRAASPW